MQPRHSIISRSSTQCVAATRNSSRSLRVHKDLLLAQHMGQTIDTSNTCQVFLGRIPQDKTCGTKSTYFIPHNPFTCRGHTILLGNPLCQARSVTCGCAEFGVTSAQRNEEIHDLCVVWRRTRFFLFHTFETQRIIFQLTGPNDFFFDEASTPRKQLAQLSSQKKFVTRFSHVRPHIFQAHREYSSKKRNALAKKKKNTSRRVPTLHLTLIPLRERPQCSSSNTTGCVQFCYASVGNWPTGGFYRSLPSSPNDFERTGTRVVRTRRKAFHASCRSCSFPPICAGRLSSATNRYRASVLVNRSICKEQNRTMSIVL